MKRLAYWAIVTVVFASSLMANSMSVGDGGGRDVSVALFSTRRLLAVTVTPLGPQSWTASCERCAHVPLTTQLHVSGAMDIFAGGPLRITDNATGESRASNGLWHVRANEENHETDVVLTLPSERYVAAVLNAEAEPSEPPESLRALAILVRTFALNSSHFPAQPGHLAANLCDSTQCQAMRLGSVSSAIEDATLATTGETVWFGPRRAEVFFSQHCGGITEDASAAWPGFHSDPYLRSHVDPYCVRHDSAAWHAEVPLNSLSEIAQLEGWHLPANIMTARVVERSASHRALKIVFTAGNGAEATISGSALRFGIDRALGWNRVRSDAFELGVRNGAVVFDGRGYGHGVGLCQAGAAEMAAEGKSAREILAFYFSGTTVGISPEDGGWLETRSGPLTIRGTQAISEDRKASLERTWSEAQRRFPLGHGRDPVTPEIVFAPTTEVFRQLTTQPGWTLASTSGSVIVLQPDSVLRAHGNDASATLLHEMLHVLVEAESSQRAPLWLREGLVEVLASEPAKTGTGTGKTMIPSENACKRD